MNGKDSAIVFPLFSSFALSWAGAKVHAKLFSAFVWIRSGSKAGTQQSCSKRVFANQREFYHTIALSTLSLYCSSSFLKNELSALMCSHVWVDSSAVLKCIEFITRNLEQHSPRAIHWMLGIPLVERGNGCIYCSLCLLSLVYLSYFHFLTYIPVILTPLLQWHSYLWKVRELSLKRTRPLLRRIQQATILNRYVISHLHEFYREVPMARFMLVFNIRAMNICAK